MTEPEINLLTKIVTRTVTQEDFFAVTDKYFEIIQFIEGNNTTLSSFGMEGRRSSDMVRYYIDHLDYTMYSIHQMGTGAYYLEVYR